MLNRECTINIDYVMDLGLIRKEGQELIISNPVYREIIVRELTYAEQYNLAPLFKSPCFVRPDNSLDMPKLITAFQEFYRENSEVWLERLAYREAGPHLLMQAFLQRIINGGGRIGREYGLGRMRTDLLVLWPLVSVKAGVTEMERWAGKVQKCVIELKVLHKSLEKTTAQGLKQTAEYMDKCGTDDGHLIVFDRTEGRKWDEKIFRREQYFAGRRIMVWGM